MSATVYKCHIDNSYRLQTQPLTAGETTDAELASFAGETTTVCSILTSNEDNLDIREPSLIQPESQPSPLPPEIPPHPKSRQSPTPSMLSEFPDYQGYENMVVKMPAPSASHDRGTELFLSQYYKALEQEQDNTRPSPLKLLYDALFSLGEKRCDDASQHMRIQSLFVLCRGEITAMLAAL